jgi:hypothetical protein
MAVFSSLGAVLCAFILPRFVGKKHNLVPAAAATQVVDRGHFRYNNERKMR